MIIYIIYPFNSSEMIEMFGPIPVEDTKVRDVSIMYSN